MKNGLKIALAVGAVLIVAMVVALVLLRRQVLESKSQVAAMEDLMNFEKEQVEDEYSDMAMQFDGYSMTIGNDSLVQLLGQEQQRVRDLLEELRTTKATDARRIAELKKELATVRTIMVGYVHQIDSLDRTNKRLVSENREVREKYQTVSQQAEQLQKDKESLNEVVNRASMMEVANFTATTLNAKGRTTSRYSQIDRIQMQFSVLKNITAQPGNKTVYVRLVRPDGEVMMKNAGDLFTYENKQIAYSVKKMFEFAGEALSITLYWKVEEVLPIGTYNADFFIDGSLVGSFPFRIEK